MEVKEVDKNIEIPEEVMAEAVELCRGAEVLPDGAKGLARKIMQAKQAGRPLVAKLGVDPTSTDLHLGHAVVFRKLRRFQDFGHQVILIIGGFTAQIGDPTGRNATRPPLDEKQVQANAQTYLNQMGLILDLNKTKVVNNNDWLAPLTMKEVIKLAASVTANQLLAKEAFGERLDKQQPVAFHELFYPLLQAYDSVAIQADIELGGTDQRFNILQGRELQPKYGQEPQMAMLLPLLEGTDGVKKMSKSYNNYVGLKEDPQEMFGKCMRIPDELILKYFELTTTLAGHEVDKIEAEHLKEGGNPKDAKLKLAKQVVFQYHGAEAAEQALKEWQQVHSQGQLPDEMPIFKIEEEQALFRVLALAGLVSSNAEAKRLIQEGGVKLNGETVKDPNLVVSLQGADTSVVQVGRRKFVKVVAQ
ncbi:MAG: tyrosine--tRNA ligase [Candidatus Melainabacteria bacterium]|nr:tyrosine--tRNA ligase [Candidatus Melainabacteria bacterium]OPZ87996.1 MAG: Tyrosine--tRNA ligase [bacterium ADurb.Bin425]